MHLIILDGEQAGKHCSLEQETTIGRDETNSLVIDDKWTSRRHSTITCENHTYWIKDLNSTHGTMLNNVTIQKALLHEGDILTIGKTNLLFTNKDIATARNDLQPIASITETLPAAYTIIDSSQVDFFKKDAGHIHQDMLFTYYSHLQTLYTISHLIHSIVDMPELCDHILNLMFNYFKADRGFIVLWNEDKHAFEPLVVKRKDGTLIDPNTIQLSHTIINYVIKNKKSILSANAMDDERFKTGASIVDLQLHAMMCVPLTGKDTIIGLLQIESMDIANRFTEHDLEFLTAIGNTAGIALQNMILFKKVVKAEKLASIGETIAGMFHYMKNILQGLKGGIHFLESGLNQQKQNLVNEGAKLVKESEQRISTLVQNMLNYSKGRTPSYTPSNINDIINEIVASVKTRSELDGISFTVQVDQATQPFLMDATGIHNALLNLVINAIEAVPHNTGTICITTKLDTPSSALRISVKDNGAGINPDIQYKMFEPFYSSKGHKGTGLGLAVTKKIIEEHRGHITFHSTLNEGTEFIITLPYRTQ